MDSKQMKHTPGPWAVSASETRVIAPMRHVICADIQGRTFAECQANARLIAAAPDLLDALELAMSYIRNDHGRNPLDVRREAVDAAGAAIAKAKGE